MDETRQIRHAPEGVRPSRLAAAALLAFAAAFVVNLGVRWLGQAVLGAGDDDPVLATASIALTTLFGTGAAAVGLHVLLLQAAHPLHAFRRLAVLALVLSLLGPLAAALGWAPSSDDVGLGTFVTLVLMHLATMVIIVSVLSAAVRSSVPERRR